MRRLRLSKCKIVQKVCASEKIILRNPRSWRIIPIRYRQIAHAGVAELADAYGSGPYGGNPMKVQVLSPAPLNFESRSSERLFYLRQAINPGVIGKKACLIRGIGAGRCPFFVCLNSSAVFNHSDRKCVQKRSVDAGQRSFFMPVNSVSPQQKNEAALPSGFWSLMLPFREQLPGSSAYR